MYHPDVWQGAFTGQGWRAPTYSSNTPKETLPHLFLGFPGGSVVKNPPAMQGMQET